MILSYSEFILKLDRRIREGNDFYAHLLKTTIDAPKRYTGIFRISSVKTKLVQNVTQSNEIKFGDFMEEIVTDYIEKIGFTNLPKHYPKDDETGHLNIDQHFSNKEGTIYLVEQKIRDDHDSTKKRGQLQNFFKKINRVTKKYPCQEVDATMWFIDDGLQKNKKYYETELRKLNIPKVKIHVLYGRQMFEEILESSICWDEINSYLLQNKVNRSDSLLFIPDFDTSDEGLDALNSLDLKSRKKLMSGRPEMIQLRNELFPTSLNLIRAGFIK